MASEILINVRPFETRVAYVVGGVLNELKIERKSSPTLVGTIHRGRVIRVLPGMQAAFVDIGLEKAAFLYVGDIRADFDENAFENESDEEIILEETDPRPQQPQIPIQDLISEGQHILVQVAKDPLGTKGARLTTHISLPGRFIVYLPTVRHLGISRKITDDAERERLRKRVVALNPPGGMIIRTAGEGASEESLRNDIEYLDRLSKEIFKSYEKKKTPGPIHTELDVELRALRDLLSEDVTAVYVDDLEAHKRIIKFINQLMPKYKQNVMLYQDKKPLFDLYDIELEISRSIDRKIWLKSGGYIVIDEAEALVVVDVNTGKYVGKKDLDETILKTNLESVKEIAHQLRIRNCGGIVIIDFIDMTKEGHREKVMALLNDELKKDRAKTNVISMSTLGLVEMTRKRISPSLVKTLCEPCRYCDGKAYIKKKSTVALEIFRGLEREWSHLDNRKVKIFVHCHSEVIDWIYEVESENLAFVENKIGQPVNFKAETHYHIEQYEVFMI